ncbi:MAG: hypothetical protein Q8P04_01000 [bacterium]|nr:hypothetical protein [bacterium]
MKGIRDKIQRANPPSLRLRRAKGAITLPIFLMITLIIFELAVAGVVAANALNNTFFGERLTAEAWQAARAGAGDAIMRVIRTCPLSNCATTSYSLPVGSRSTAQVTIARDPVSGNITINSTGEAFTRKKKIEVILGVDQGSGRVRVQSFKEVAL